LAIGGNVAAHGRGSESHQMPPQILTKRTRPMAGGPRQHALPVARPDDTRLYRAISDDRSYERVGSIVP